MRTAEFDREQVLRAAIKAFITKGYNKTSMQDLKQATGLHPGSIYCAFDNKQGLLLAALQQYNKDKAELFQKYFTGNPTVLDGVRRYLECTVQECAGMGAERVCLSQKALSELALQAPDVEQFINEGIRDWQQGFANVFQQALEQGEINGERSPMQRAQSLVMGIYGLRSYANTDPEEGVLAELASQLFKDVCR
ncbi:TetR/AcrR family transcriptional regulator [Veronia pacifica]|uniref:TetR family transcriptional regulator n=1 Tax=Veronia pacifica TaxID=1080227 RepID=A0A1C3ESZ6_9GAMM|nr:TetR/AcrR family transcriptional regulator [Veronia pacifica]ODA36305.1 TetR family transcriptional regulator [Veronia pacifica]